MKLKLDIIFVQQIPKTTIIFTALIFFFSIGYDSLANMTNNVMAYYWWSCYWSCTYNGFSL